MRPALPTGEPARSSAVAPLPARAATALAGLSPTARIGQLNQRLKGWEAVRWIDGRPRVTDTLRAEVDRWGGLGALYGVLRADPWSAVRWGDGIPPERSAEAYAAVQEHVLRHGEGVPVLFVEEAPHGLMALGGTTLPVNLALGAGMDAELTRELGVAVAAEARERGTHLLLVSGLDVLRDPRWGRAEECYGEDAALAALLVEATVQGMQGVPAGERIDDRHVAVVAKHLAAQGAGTGGRNGSGAPLGRRELGEIHLRPAYVAARAGVAGFMSAYNDVDGVPCTGDRDLLTGTLREAWGWEGVVMSDGGAIDRLVRAVDGGPTGAAALALRAGVDLSLWDHAYTQLGDAVAGGLVDGAAVDRAAGRVLALKDRLGLLGPTAAATDRGPGEDGAVPTGTDRTARATAVLGERAARQSVVVLEEGDLLPLRARTVAVVGPNADDLDALLGDYTPPRPPADDARTVREAFVDRLGVAAVTHALGCRHRAPAEGDALAAVTRAAEGAEVTVAVLGGTSRRSYDDEFADNGAVEGPAQDTTTGEGADLSRVELPAHQLEVLRAARVAGRPVVAVVVEGRPRALTGLEDLADTVLIVPFPGPSGGRAVVDALVEDSVRGLLPATLPAAASTLPVSHDLRRETARGYLDQRAVRGPLLGSGLPAGVRVQVAAATTAVRGADLAAGAVLPLTVTVMSTRRDPVSVPIPVYGRRHESGILPRARTVLAVRRLEVTPGSVEAVLPLGLDELGSWAGGAPAAVPVEVEIWAEPVLEPPAGALRVRVTP